MSAAHHDAASRPAAAPATLEVRDLRTHFFTRAGTLPAVDGVSFTLERGKILGLVGESGSGKSVTGFSIMGLVDAPGRVVGGQVLFQGRDLTQLAPRELRKLQGNRIAMIFQDPMMTLNPVLRVDAQMIETVRAHSKVSRAQARELARDTLGMMGIPSPEERLLAYPHQLSGGMRQRVAIAIAMLHRPDLIIADEPTTALDVTIQAQILSEVQKLAQQHGTSLIWITHDLSVVAGLADEVAVMYAGRIVEHGTVDDVLDRPQHPYTVGLIDSLPSNNRRGQRLRQIPGMTPNLLNLPLGCAFATRCARQRRLYPHAPHQRGPARPPRALLPPHHPDPGGGGMSGTERQTDAARRDATANPARDAQDATATQGAATPLIELRNISKRFGERPVGAAGRLLQRAGLSRPPAVTRAVDGVDLIVRPGEVVGLVGESGCGKSTLGRVAAGLLTPSGGEVRINGLRPADMTPAQAHQARLKVR